MKTTTEGRGTSALVRPPWPQLALVVLIRAVLAVEIWHTVAHGQTLLHQAERVVVARRVVALEHRLFAVDAGELWR